MAPEKPASTAHLGLRFALVPKDSGCGLSRNPSRPPPLTAKADGAQGDTWRRAHPRFPIAHRKVIRTTNLLKPLFVEERLRLQVVPNVFGERAVLKFMYEAMIRAAERRRGFAGNPVRKPSVAGRQRAPGQRIPGNERDKIPSGKDHVPQGFSSRNLLNLPVITRHQHPNPSDCRRLSSVSKPGIWAAKGVRGFLRTAFGCWRDFLLQNYPLAKTPSRGRNKFCCLGPSRPARQIVQ